jgi:hypothetical protein
MSACGDENPAHCLSVQDQGQRTQNNISRKEPEKNRKARSIERCAKANKMLYKLAK